MNNILISVIVILAAPFLGGFLFGVDRRITARMQRRMGPPLLQPFYDFLKLWGKEQRSCNGLQLISVSLYLAAMVLSLVMLVTGQDLLALLFVLAVGSVSLILGAYSVKSPYSQLGAQREVLSLLAYEPLLVLMVVATYQVVAQESGGAGSFLGSSVYALKRPLLLSLPLFWLTQTIVIAIKLHKSPFDIGASHHAHQELVRGIYTEYSGRHLALIELAHWYELALLLGFVAILWHTNAVIGAALALLSLFATILLDNVTARLTWRWVVRFAWTACLALAFANLAALYVVPWLWPSGGPP